MPPPRRQPARQIGSSTVPRRPGPSRRADRSQRDEPRRPRLPEPELPDDLPAGELDRAAMADLRGLPDGLVEKITRHLVAAAMLLDDDPQQAHAHAWYARSLAPRLAILREAAGLTAYRTGDFAAALAELRAVRRMTGDPAHLPVIADCERGLGRPERALAAAKDPDAARLEPAARVELAIVVSGARRDLGEYDAAVVGLEGAALRSAQAEPWTVRLWYAYAEALLAAGRPDDARRWFESAAALDDDEETDAAERVLALGERPGAG